MADSPTKPLWKLCADAAQDAERRRDYATAEKQYRWSLALAETARGKVHEDVGEAMINLADFYFGLKRFEESECAYQRALDVYERLFGKDNLVATMIYRMLARLTLAQRNVPDTHLVQAHHDTNITDARQAS